MILVPGALPREGAHHEAGWLAVEVLGVVAASVLSKPLHTARSAEVEPTQIWLKVR